MKTMLIFWVVGGYNDGGAALSIKEPIWFANAQACEAAAKKIMNMPQHGYAVAVCITPSNALDQSQTLKSE